VTFPDYAVDELVAIGELMMSAQGYALDPAAEPVFQDYLTRRAAQPRFANARSVRNALERARLRQANRLLAAGRPVGREQLTPAGAGGLPAQPRLHRPARLNRLRGPQSAAAARRPGSGGDAAD